jgi:hypothetical protein
MNNDKIVFDEKEKKFYKDKYGICTAKNFKEIFECKGFELGSVMGLAGCFHKRYTACIKEIKNEQKD